LRIEETKMNVSKEDLPLLIGGAIAVAGILTQNTYATAAGLAVALGGKAVNFGTGTSSEPTATKTG
jgi:hypothetical protein